MASASIPLLLSDYIDDREGVSSAYYSRAWHPAVEWRGYECNAQGQYYTDSQYSFSGGHQWTEDVYTDWPLPLTDTLSVPAVSWARSETLMSALTPPQLLALPSSSLYTLPSPSLRYILPHPGCPSPSSISSSLSASPISSPAPVSSPSSPAPPTSTSMSKKGAGKACSHCNTTTTPLWRRDPRTRQPLCNACGLYLQQRHKPRPAALIAADLELQSSPNSDELEEGQWAPDAPKCTHCGARKTSVWRRAKDGKRLCNACGVYVRLRGRPRPAELKQSRVRPRARHA